MKKTRMAVAAMLAGVVAAPAFAVLGEAVDSVQADRTAMRAKAQVVSAGTGSYTVHEMQMASGTVVREYAAPDGKIFAIAWEGPALPDIRHLLGMYFEQYAGALQGRRPAQRHVSVRQTDLVVESHGRMGAFSGQAYLPRSLPQGVTPDALQ